MKMVMVFVMMFVIVIAMMRQGQSGLVGLG